ncbi:MAG: transporter permease [Bacilli bacterium]|nr:transporter permease [Bacilli bacterium]
MKKKRGLKGSTIRQIEGSLFIAPWVFGFLAFMAFPLGYTFWMAFYTVQIKVDGIHYTWVGFKNYQTILTGNSDFISKVLPYLEQVLVMLPVILVFSLLAAILLNQKFRGRAFFRAIFFLPVIFSSSMIVKTFMQQSQGGLDFVQQYNVTGLVTMYFSKSLATPLIYVLNNLVIVLWYSGVQILLFLAGRQTISLSVYEAARIDGGSPWEVFWKITLPGMTPFIFLNLIYTVVDMFTFSDNPLLTLITPQMNYGYGSALSWLYFAVILIFLGICSLIFITVTTRRPAR